MSDLLDPAHCSQSDEWSVGFPGAVCDNTVDFHRLSFNNPAPSSLRAKDAVFTNTHGMKTHSSQIHFAVYGSVGVINSVHVHCSRHQCGSLFEEEDDS